MSVKQSLGTVSSQVNMAQVPSSVETPTMVRLKRPRCRYKVALLVNFIPPYRVPLFEALAREFGQLRVFVSTSIEPNRSWTITWGTLEVVVQRNVMLRKRWHPSNGFSDIGYVHLPYDTFHQLRRFQPDVVISGELGLRTALAAVYRRIRPTVRLIVWATVSEHTERRRGRLREVLRRKLVRYADAVLVNGDSVGRYIEGLGVPPTRIIRAPYTTDTSLFSRAKIRTDAGGPFRLLFVGLLIERKGLVPFFRVLRHWGERHPSCAVTFLLAGDGPQREELARMPMPPNVVVRFLGSVSYDQLPDIYAETDALVLPTLADEWAVVVNEAMTLGIPVLGSMYSQAVEELVLDNKTGWTFYPDRTESVYEALDRALGTPPERREAMGAAARARALQLTPEIVAANVADAIMSTTKRSS